MVAIKVGPKEAGLRLIALLKNHCPGHLSVKAIKRAIDEGRCTVNGKIERFSTRLLQAGDRVEIEPFEEKGLIKALPILYEDNALIICNKPPGVVSEPATLRPFFSKKSFELVHRLDKDTSGVLILAKTSDARVKMEALFKKRAIRKHYLALVSGEVKEREGKIENFLARKSVVGGLVTWGSVKGKGGKKAVTEWKCLQHSSHASLLSLEPLTGRTHQLRVHLSEWGHPILGDVQYAKKLHPHLRPRRQLLHAYKVVFEHPMTGEVLEVVAPLPDVFREFLSQLHFEV